MWNYNYCLFMKMMFVTLLLWMSYSLHAQKKSVFKNINFDSSYRILALSSSFTHPEEVSNENCFLVDSLPDMQTMKNEWIVKNAVATLHLEANSIDLYITKNKELISSNFIIYPRQSIINIENSWYDFDIKKFTQIQKTHPLQYHSQSFQFDTYLAYAFFRDSVRNRSDFLFLFEPTLPFEGSFYITISRTADKDSPIFVLDDLNKELEKISSAKAFTAIHPINDDFNLHHTDKVRILVQGSKALYNAYQNKHTLKGEWIPATFDTKVIFKD